MDQIRGLLSFGGSSSFFGLSIGATSVKLAGIKKSGKQFKLTHYSQIDIADEVVVNREILVSSAVTDAITQAIQALGKTKVPTVCSAVAGNGVIIKRMDVEVKNIKELEEQVFWEAEQYIPFDPTQVIVDFELLSKTKDARKEILLVAAKKNIVETLIETIRQSGTVAKVVDLEPFALQNVFETNYSSPQGQSVVLVDIGASALTIVVSANGIPLFTKESTLGGKALTQEIQRHLNLQFSDAEGLKRSSSAEVRTIPQEILEIMGLMSENFAAEIKRALDYYSASVGGPPVAYVLLTGGSSQLPGLSKCVEDLVKVPVQMLNPFTSIGFDPNSISHETITRISPFAAIPVGLALRAAAT